MPFFQGVQDQLPIPCRVALSDNMSEMLDNLPGEAMKGCLIASSQARVLGVLLAWSQPPSSHSLSVFLPEPISSKKITCTQ